MSIKWKVLKFIIKHVFIIKNLQIVNDIAFYKRRNKQLTILSSLFILLFQTSFRNNIHLLQASYIIFLTQVLVSHFAEHVSKCFFNMCCKIWILYFREEMRRKPEMTIKTKKIFNCQEIWLKKLIYEHF